MNGWFTNVTADHVLRVVIGLTLATWIVGKVSDAPSTTGDYFYPSGLVMSLVVIDHLHGIRRALEAHRDAQRGGD